MLSRYRGGLKKGRTAPADAGTWRIRMSDRSKIEWTDRTWNPVRGCTEISPGCKNCYAKTFAERWRGVPGHAYEQGFDLRLVPEKLGAEGVESHDIGARSDGVEPLDV